jgi:hypothetical protein
MGIEHDPHLSQDDDELAGIGGLEVRGKAFIWSAVWCYEFMNLQLLA